jgi:hypothetical protein
MIKGLGGKEISSQASKEVFGMTEDVYKPKPLTGRYNEGTLA